MTTGRKKMYVQFEDEEDINKCHTNSEIMFDIKFHSPGLPIRDKGKLEKLRHSVSN